jgi:hypothetical protein
MMHRAVLRPAHRAELGALEVLGRERLVDSLERLEQFAMDIMPAAKGV